MNNNCNNFEEKKINLNYDYNNNNNNNKIIISNNNNEKQRIL